MASGAIPLDEAAAIRLLDVAAERGRELTAIDLARRLLAAQSAPLGALRMRLAERLMSRGDPTSAETIVLPMIDDPASSLAVWMLAAELAELRGDRARARTLYERVVARDYSFPQAKERAARLRETEGGPKRDAGATLVAEGATTRRYRLREELGRGGAGTVFLAEEPALDRLVALKVYHRKGRADRERLLAEARSAVSLAHPGVVRILDVDEVLGAIAMEPLLEGSVKSARERGASTEQLRGWMLGVVGAVEHVHRRGIVHCDLKPSNFLVRGPRSAVLTDFGLARPIGAPPRERGEGTLGYMSAEQRAGASADPAMDVYAIGVALRELLGEAPEIAALAEAMCAAEPSRRPALADVAEVLRT
jgi:eukaryotic-like serine/threonine-protein kinase